MRPIDADEVTRDIVSFKYSKEYGEVEEVYNRAVSDCIVDIEATPTLKDVKPVAHAHWDVIDGDSEGDETFLHVWETLRCSCCGMERTTEDGYMPQYCESCGAKMDEGA